MRAVRSKKNIQLNLRYFYTSCAMRVDPSNIRQGITSRSKGWFTPYVTFLFRRGTSPFSKIFSCVVKRDVHTDRNVSVTCQFHSVAVSERECLTWRNWSGPVCTWSIPIMWTVLRLLHYASSVCLQQALPVFSSEMDEKLIELVRKCEELYDMSNKKYIESVWKEKLWGQIGEELK